MNASVFKIKSINTLAGAWAWMARTARKVRILTFHGIDRVADDIFSITPQQFKDFLTTLTEEGRQTIRANDLVERWPAVLQDDNLVLLTFDDGYVCHREIVADLLVQNGMTATFFIVSSFVHRQRKCARFMNHERLFLSSDDLREMQAAGFEIGSHSHSHPLCGAIPADKFYQEALLSKQILEDAIGHPIASFSYPYGRKGAYTKTTMQILRNIGYISAFTQEGLPLDPSSTLLELPRINIDRFDTVQSFRRKLYGYYEVVARIRGYVKRS